MTGELDLMWNGQYKMVFLSLGSLKICGHQFPEFPYQQNSGCWSPCLQAAQVEKQDISCCFRGSFSSGRSLNSNARLLYLFSKNANGRTSMLGLGAFCIWGQKASAALEKVQDPLKNTSLGKDRWDLGSSGILQYFFFWVLNRPWPCSVWAQARLASYDLNKCS